VLTAGTPLGLVAARGIIVAWRRGDCVTVSVADYGALDTVVNDL